MEVAPKPNGLRAHKKLTIRNRLKRCAMELFIKQGYTKTTLEQVAEKAAISARTLFRYFPTKEDLLFDDDYDAHIVESFLKQPSSISIITAFRNALTDAFGQMTDEQRSHERLRHVIVMETPELRARNNHELVRNIELVIMLIAKRTHKQATDLQIRVLAGALVGVIISAQIGSKNADPLKQIDNSLKQFEELMTKGVTDGKN